MNINSFKVAFRFSAAASAKDESVSNKNIKRENKLYSYKEQMAELELRKEMEKKKKLKGEAQKPQVKLSKKQQEMVDDTLKREQAVRDRCKQVRMQVSGAV